MEITNGEINVELPDSLAKLLVENGKGDWQEGTSDVVPAGRFAPPGGGPRSGRSLPAGDAGDQDDSLLPVTRIPGVVDISMPKVRKLVAEGKVPFVKRGRTKLVRPSDVRAALEAG